MKKDLKETIEFLQKWAVEENLITKLYIFGSRVRNDYHVNSDIDIAIQIDKKDGDENVEATWIGESRKWKEYLAKNLPFQPDLQLLNGTNTPTIVSAIEESSIPVYHS